MTSSEIEELRAYLDARFDAIDAQLGAVRTEVHDFEAATARGSSGSRRA